MTNETVYSGRLIMYASPEQLNVFWNSDTLFAEGTFKVCPKLLDQLYVLLGMQNGEGMFSFIFIHKREIEKDKRKRDHTRLVKKTLQWVRAAMRRKKSTKTLLLITQDWTRC